MQQNRFGELHETNFRLEFHGARRAGFDAGIAAGAGGNLEIDLVMSCFVSGSGHGFGWADILADWTKDAVVIDGWDRPVLWRFVSRAWFERELTPLPFIWDTWSLERGHNAWDRVFWHDLRQAAFTTLKDFFERISSRDGFGWRCWNWCGLSRLAGLMLEHRHIQRFAAQVPTVHPGNLKNVLEALWYGRTTNFAGCAIASDQLQFLIPGARGEDHGWADPTETLDVCGIPRHFGAGQNGHRLERVSKPDTLILQCAEHGQQVVLERTGWTNLHAQTAARAGILENFDVIRDPDRIVRAGIHALVATTDRIFFDQAARAGVFRARIGDFEERVKNGFQHRLFKLTCSRWIQIEARGLCSLHHRFDVVQKGLELGKIELLFTIGQGHFWVRVNFDVNTIGPNRQCSFG
jgi:hypothetical protein